MICDAGDLGIGIKELLNRATVKPREKWGLESNNIQKGNKSDFLLMDGNPFENIESLNFEKLIISDK